MRRVTRRLIPFVFVLYLFNFLERSNVGLAALQSDRDPGFSAAAVSVGAGRFSSRSAVSAGRRKPATSCS